MPRALRRSPSTSSSSALVSGLSDLSKGSPTTPLPLPYRSTLPPPKNLFQRSPALHQRGRERPNPRRRTSNEEPRRARQTPPLRDRYQHLLAPLSEVQPRASPARRGQRPAGGGGILGGFYSLDAEEIVHGGDGDATQVGLHEEDHLDSGKGVYGKFVAAKLKANGWRRSTVEPNVRFRPDVGRKHWSYLLIYVDDICMLEDSIKPHCRTR